jgi:tetratricopeptide (TPR) repeat protein
MEAVINGRINKSLIGIAIGAVLGLIACSCSEGDLERQFRMEKAIDEANRLKKQYDFSGGGLDQSEIDELTEAFRRVTEMVSAPAGDSAGIKGAPEPLRVSWQLAGLAYYNLGLIEMDLKNYEAAYGYLQTLIDHYGFRQNQVQRALFMQAIARYKQKRYLEAISLYSRAARSYAEAPEAVYRPNLDILDSPLISARIYQDMDSRTRFEDQIEEAVDYYTGIITAYEGTALADAAIGKLASAFLMANLGDSAVEALSGIADPKTGNILPLAQLNIGRIQQFQVKNYRAAEKSYRAFMKNYPDNDMAALAQMGIGISLFNQEEYEKARFELSLVEKTAGSTTDLVAEAHYLTAYCFELEGKWQRALGEYDYAWANHASTKSCMMIPLHIAEYYAQEGKVELARRSLSEAESDYTGLADTYAARPDIASEALGYLIRTYIMGEKWDQAVETMKNLAHKYPKTLGGYSALPRAARILDEKLRRPSDAVDLLGLYLEKFPDSPDRENVTAYADSLKTELQ